VTAPTLAAAAQALASACDGARAHDGAGFNAYDADFGRLLAATPEARWTPRMRIGAWRMLRKYRGQLAGAGIDFGAIPEPPSLEAIAHAPAKPQATRRIRLEGEAYIIEFPYDPAVVAAVRNVPGRRFDGAAKRWTAPANEAATVALAILAAEHGLDVEPEAAAYMAGLSDSIREAQEQAAALAALVAEQLERSAAADAAPVDIPGLHATLYGYQRASMHYLERALFPELGPNRRRAIIADEMGLGKTIQALAAAEHFDAYPALIVVPAAVKINWYRQARRFLPRRGVLVLDGATPPSYRASIIIVNYDVVGRHAEALARLPLKALVLDESHYAKNKRAARTRHLLAIAQATDPELVLLLSGTPLTNRPAELSSQLEILGVMKPLFGTAHKFAQRFCGAVHNGYGLDTSGASNLRELNATLRGRCYIRRTNDDVRTELPPRWPDNMIPIPITNRLEYRRAETELVAWLGEQAERDRLFLDSIAHLLDGTDAGLDAHRAAVAEHRNSAEERAARAEQLIRFTALKKLAARGKMEGAIEWVRNHLDSGQRLVLFAHHREIVHEVAAAFEAPYITGDVALARRQAMVDAFRRPDGPPLLVLNMQAGGTGIDGLQENCWHAAFLELGWSPAIHDQAVARLDRTGQTRPVTAHYLLAEATIDTEIAALIDAKRVVVNEATDGTAAKESEAAGILAALAAKLASAAPAAEPALIL
jgi:SWI/SNF-related matrix-associated actin-dependent regulator of chromatin subfamily A-like protein 1